MKWFLLLAGLAAVAGVLIFLDWKNVEDRLENWAAERIESALHSSGGAGGGSGGSGVLTGFAKGIGKKVLNKELGLG